MQWKIEAKQMSCLFKVTSFKFYFGKYSKRAFQN